MINDDIIEILVCPKCRGVLKFGKDKNTIDCNTCKLAYEIKDETPILLIDKARKIENDN